jgi:hypothetical protein
LQPLRIMATTPIGPHRSKAKLPIGLHRLMLVYSWLLYHKGPHTGLWLPYPLTTNSHVYSTSLFRPHRPMINIKTWAHSLMFSVPYGTTNRLVASISFGTQMAIAIQNNNWTAQPHTYHKYHKYHMRMTTITPTPQP